MRCQLKDLQTIMKDVCPEFKVCEITDNSSITEILKSQTADVLKVLLLAIPDCYQILYNFEEHKWYIPFRDGNPNYSTCMSTQFPCRAVRDRIINILKERLGVTSASSLI